MRVSRSSRHPSLPSTAIKHIKTFNTQKKRQNDGTYLYADYFLRIKPHTVNKIIKLNTAEVRFTLFFVPFLEQREL